MLEDGTYRRLQRSPTPKKVTRSFVNRTMRLTLLALDIVEAILEGRQPKAIQLEELTHAIPSEWEKQRRALLSGVRCVEVERSRQEQTFERTPS